MVLNRSCCPPPLVQSGTDTPAGTRARRCDAYPIDATDPHGEIANAIRFDGRSAWARADAPQPS
jgi:hypothetical protein